MRRTLVFFVANIYEANNTISSCYGNISAFNRLKQDRCLTEYKKWIRSRDIQSNIAFSGANMQI